MLKETLGRNSHTREQRQGLLPPQSPSLPAAATEFQSQSPPAQPGGAEDNKTRMLLTCEIEDAIIPAPHHDVIHCQGDGDGARGGGVHRGAVILQEHGAEKG